MARKRENKHTSSKAGAPTGRPRFIQSPEEFDELVDAHVEYCVNNGEPLTWTGMALALGLTSRVALDKYANLYPEFKASAARAKAIIEHGYEARLHGQSPTGAIFALKNMDWKDKTEHDMRSPDGSMSPRPLNEFYANEASDGEDEADD